MSIPENPLDKFRSYSYHHILLASNSTEAMRGLIYPSNDGVYQESTILNNVKLGEKINISDNATAYMLCDTRFNSYFSITDVSYSSHVSVGSKGITNIIVGELDMNITDPSGISFLNYIRWITDEQLKVSLFKTIFLLKTIFVGHTFDGKTETIYQDATTMLLQDMTVNPSHHGSVIAAKFIPISNGAASVFADFAKIYDIGSVHSKTGLLKDAIKSFESQMNKKSREWYREIQLKVLAKAEAENKDVTPAEGYGKLVQYMFTIPDDWDNFRVIGIYDMVKEIIFGKGKRSNTETRGVKIGFQPTPETRITDVLETILKHCTDVQKLASNEKRVEGNLKFYQILTSVTSDDDTLVVHYDIVNYAIPKVEQDSNKKEGSDTVKKTPIFDIDDKKNVMVFDYIFTGKNRDILALDMKLNNVNLFIADSIVSGDKPAKEDEKDQKDKSNDSTKDKKSEIVLNIREKDPITVPMKTGSQQQNMSFITQTDDRNDAVKSRQQFIHNISMAHGVSSLNIIMKIRGNPNLYKRFNDSHLLPHVKIQDNVKDIKYVSKSDKFIEGNNGNYLLDNDISEYKKALNDVVIEMGAQQQTQAVGSPSVLPLFIKVNINGQEYDVLDKSKDAFSDFKPYKQMWYDGYYMVQKIEHKFSNGEFTQDLLIGAIPADLYSQVTTDKAKAEAGKSESKDANSSKDKNKANSDNGESDSIINRLFKFN